MSEWYEVKDPDDVDLSDDGKFVHVLFDTNRNGNRYAEVPVEMLKKLLGDVGGLELADLRADIAALREMAERRLELLRRLMRELGLEDEIPEEIGGVLDIPLDLARALAAELKQKSISAEGV